MAERVTFSSTTGPSLAGLVELPVGEVRGWGVFAHGFTLGKDCPAASRTCKQLASEGIGMLRFDNLGLGDSEGDWGDGSFSNKVADTVLAGQPVTLRTLRLRKGLSQAQLAEAIGTQQPHIARIENGHSDLRLDTCRRIAQVLGIDLNTLDQALQAETGQ